MRLVFAGTPEAAVPSLAALLDSGHEVAAVLTRPDAPAGRGLQLHPSPVAVAAAAAGIEILTPRRPSDPQFQDRLRQIAPDCCAVVAYGALIPDAVLAIPPHGWVNLHFSLLPAWRPARHHGGRRHDGGHDVPAGGRAGRRRRVRCGDRAHQAQRHRR
jgi:methionyl-tRNA formyltransferase